MWRLRKMLPVVPMGTRPEIVVEVVEVELEMLLLMDSSQADL